MVTDVFLPVKLSIQTSVDYYEQSTISFIVKAATLFPLKSSILTSHSHLLMKENFEWYARIMAEEFSFPFRKSWRRKLPFIQCIIDIAICQFSVTLLETETTECHWQLIYWDQDGLWAQKLQGTSKHYSYLPPTSGYLNKLPSSQAQKSKYYQ